MNTSSITINPNPALWEFEKFFKDFTGYDLNEYQKAMYLRLRQDERINIFSTGPHVGDTTFLLAYVIANMLSNTGMNILYVPYSAREADRILKRIAHLYKEVPAFYKPGECKNMAPQLLLFPDGNNRVQACSAAQCEEGRLRGTVFDMIIGDNFEIMAPLNAFWTYKEYVNRYPSFRTRFVGTTV